MRPSHVMALAAACVLVGAANADAQAFPREPTEVVLSARDVDFHNPASVAAFDQRLRAAAMRACDSGLPKMLAVQSADSQCAQQSWEAAVRQMHEPLLSQLHGHGVDLAKNADSRRAGE